MLAKSIVVLIGTLVALGFSELAMRVLVHEQQLYEMNEDAYWKLLLARSVGVEHPPLKDIQPDPLLGWRMKANYDVGGVHHNSRGYRDRREFDESHVGSRILSIGASMTYGLGVDEKDTMTALLEASSGVQTINAGVNAYGADQALLLFEEDGRRLHPDIVVFVYHVDDFYRNGLTVRDLPKPHFAFESGEYRLAGVPVPAVESLAASGGLDIGPHLRIQEALAWFYRRASRKFRGDDLEPLQRLRNLNVYVLQRMRDSVREAGARLLVVISGHCVDGISDYVASERAIAEACQSLGIDVIDLAAVMREGDYSAGFGENCHCLFLLVCIIS